MDAVFWHWLKDKRNRRLLVTLVVSAPIVFWMAGLLQ
jgi:hypothetical protein